VRDDRGAPEHALKNGKKWPESQYTKAFQFGSGIFWPSRFDMVSNHKTLLHEEKQMQILNSGTKPLLVIHADINMTCILYNTDGSCEPMPLFHKRLWNHLPASLVGEYYHWRKEGVDAGMANMDGNTSAQYSDTKDWVEYYTRGGLLSLRVEEEFKKTHLNWDVEYRFDDSFYWNKKHRKVYTK